MKKIKNLFITGLITILPVIITIKIVSWIFKLLYKSLSSNIFIKKIIIILSKHKFYSEIVIQIIVYTVLIIIIILIITIIGLAVRNVIGKKIAKIVDQIFSKIPIVKPIYTTILQIRHLIFSSNIKAYQKVVMIEYPKDGIYSLGFLTNGNNSIITNITGKPDLLNIFIPTSPNPTSGMFVMIHHSNVTELDIKLEDAIKLIISGGAIIPKTN